MKRLLSGISLTAFTVVAASVSTAAYAGGSDLAALQAQVEALSAQVKRLEANQVDTSSVLAGGSSGAASSSFGKGFIAIPGTNTAIKIGGYAHLVTSYDIGSSYGNSFFAASNIPLDNSAADNQDGEFNMHAQQSRLSFTSMTKTDLGDLKVVLEGDFYESRGGANLTNRHGFGLRHAYGKLGNWTIGQTWTSFMDMAVYPSTVEFVGSAGTTHLRQPQIRYTSAIDANNSWSFAIENPSGDINDVSGTGSSLERFPDLIGSYTHKSDWGHIGLRALIRDLNSTNSTTNDNESDLGWAAAVSAKLKLSEADSIYGRIAFGDGIGRYLFDTAVGGVAGAVSTGTDVESQSAWGAHVTLHHDWSEKLSSNLVFGHTSIDNDTTLVGTAVNESMSSGHINLFYKPVSRVKIGVEYMHAERELESGVDGSLDRTLATFNYAF